MKLSVILPVYNEKNTIEKIVKKVKGIDLKKEIIIIDDGSTDGTRDLLKTSINQEPSAVNQNSLNDIKIIYHSTNKGKGAAIRTAIEFVTGDIVIIQDGDLEYDPRDYPRLIQPIINGEADVVYGSRILGKGKKSYLCFYWGGRFVSWIANMLYHTRITDESTGYKVFRADILRKLNLKCQGFEFCPEVTAKVCKMGYQIKEVPISYYPRRIEAGKKIRWTDGLMAIFILLKYRFFKRDFRSE